MTKRKGSGTLLIEIFSPIFYTYVGGKEEFLIQFISSPETKYAFVYDFSLHKRKELWVCQSDYTALQIN